MSAAGTPPPASWWRRRVVVPIVALLTQGITADRIAFTVAVGTACSLFPFLGFTSLLNLVVGLGLRLNQPLLQVFNQLLGPVQLALILAYVRLGEWLWQAEGDRFSVAEMVAFFRHAEFGDFLQRFGWAGVHAFTAWALTSPVLVLVVYWTLRPIMRRLASKASVRP